MKRIVASLLLLTTVWLGMRGQATLFYDGNDLSSTMITSICQDKAGYIWIGTEYGLNRFDGYRFTTYKNNPNDPQSLMFNIVNRVFCDSDGNLWVGTNIGLQRYDYATDRFVTYRITNEARPRVSDICQLPNGTVLVATSGYGVQRVERDSMKLTVLPDYQIDERDRFFEHVSVDVHGRFWKGGGAVFSLKKQSLPPEELPSATGVPTAFADLGENRMLILTRDALLLYDNGRVLNNAFDVTEVNTSSPGFITALRDRMGNVYIGTRGNGLFRIANGSRKLERFSVSAPGINVNASKIWALHEDREGNLWVGCQRKGLLLVPNRKAQFTTWSFSEQKRDIGNFVSSICQGSQGITWCTVQNEGVFGFDDKGRIVAHPSAPAGVEFIDHDNAGNYYLGTGQRLYAYSPATGQATPLVDYACDKYNCMADDRQGHLYFSTFSKGFVQYDKATRQTRHFTMEVAYDSLRGKLWNDWVMAMLTDRDGRVWMATSWGVCCFDPDNDSFRPFGWDAVCKRMRCDALCETWDGDMLMGTMDGLYIWRRKDNKVEEFPGAEPLKGTSIASIAQDNEGGLWCATSMGIWHYRPTDNKWLNFVSGAGLSVKEYIASAGLFSKDDDRIYFATGDGITTFTPHQVYDVVVPTGEVVLSNMFLGNQRVSTLTKSGSRYVTEKPVSESERFTLSYLENNVMLEFSLLNYSSVGVVFEYRLNGNSEWTRIGEGQNAVVFNHLYSGTYKLEVRAIDNGVVSEPRLITIVVTPPWYRSTLAYLLYFLVLLTLVVIGALLWRRRLQQRLDEDKMKFLINATHDIRSPLTLIMGPLEKLRKRTEDEESQAELGIIDRNAKRILALVNQILDVRKIDKQQMHLHCRETDMGEFVQTICKVFEYNAKERNITFTYEVPAEPVKAWVDRAQFDKVVTNLLSNAFKYSFDRGDIILSLTTGHDERAKGHLKDYVELTVTDNGMGMREDTIQHLFDRFFQGTTSKSAHVEGTGIGLNLCKMIVDMHHGSISGRNRTDGIKGSVFTVRLPLGNSHFAPEELDVKEEPQSVRLSGKKQPGSNYHILVVDDDEEIARYIAQELGHHYHFSMCQNGKAALKELLTNPYDLVVSDVMMPEMDGFTMLRVIRTNVNISHLPVIMLTSKTDIGNRLEGLEKGADAYLTKPFSIDELHVTIDNLIASRLRLRGKFSGSQQPTEKVQAIEVKGNDEQLMERIIKSVNTHLGDSDFNVDMLCSDVGISRAHLHRKMKEMTGIPVSEFIRNIRMEQAARLLKEQKLNITQVAYTVGYSSLPYFSVVFRKHFGVAPSEFAEQQGEEQGE